MPGAKRDTKFPKGHYIFKLMKVFSTERGEKFILFPPTPDRE